MVGGGVRLGALHCPQMARVVIDSSRVKVTGPDRQRVPSQI